MPRKLDGTYIQTGTVTTTQLSSAVTTQISAGGGPRVSSLIYPGNDTAGNTVGGQTIYINGSGFETNNAIYINGNAVPSKSFISASNLSFTTPALSTGIYPVYVINTDSGATAIFVPGYIASAEPAWVTSAGSLSADQNEVTAWSYSLSATGDAPITYALASGSTLPSGISLAANGVVSGTLSSPPGTETTYTFSVVATDAENQESTRQFTVTTTPAEGVLFANNVLLIHADGTNNKNNHTFLDSSNNNFTITRNGNATQGSFSPFSQTGWSNFFDGTGDYLALSNNAAFGLGTGDYTIEFYMYLTASPTSSSKYTLLDFRPSGSGSVPHTVYVNNSAGTLYLGFYNGSADTTSSSQPVTINSWVHCVWARSSGVIKIFVNGVQAYSGAMTTDYLTTRPLTIGSGVGGQEYMFGYMSNLRIIKGTAVYTSTFTPSTTPLTNIANTSLLTLQSNRFIDNSNNNFAITRNGDVSVQAFAPFAPTAAYSTANVGGSGYFDGTGDYLTAPSNEAFNFGTGDFTVELWYNFSSVASTQTLITVYQNSSTGWGIQWNANTNLMYWFFGDTLLMSYSMVPAVGSWAHIAVTRSGTSLRMFINGTLVVGPTNNSTSLNSSQGLYIGSLLFDTPIQNYNGYLSNIRIVKGTAVYTSAFTPPTAPLTNIANTSFLCNFTNAGIFDQTAKTVLETVGDAKVSTTQYKYGTGSMYFDGTGDRVHTGPSNPLLALGTGNFTVECWVNKSDTSAKGIWQISSTAGGLQASPSNLALGY